MRTLLPALLLAVPVATDAAPVGHPALADTQLADPARERAARALMETLRCLVCQGQSIADSDADMAADMRALVRRRIGAGESPEAVRDWLVARYGSWVSYDPPLSPASVALWMAPLLLLAGGALIALRTIGRRR